MSDWIDYPNNPDYEINPSNQAVRPKRKSELASSAGSAPLSGDWRHSEGMIFCGTLRIAKCDFDTDPSEGFRVRLLDWVCDTLNAAQNALDKRHRERP